MSTFINDHQLNGVHNLWPPLKIDNLWSFLTGEYGALSTFKPINSSLNKAVRSSRHLSILPEQTNVPFETLPNTFSFRSVLRNLRQTRTMGLTDIDDDWLENLFSPEASSSVFSLFKANHSQEDDNESHETSSSVTPLLSVADFDGSGYVDWWDIKDLALRLYSYEGDERYHPLYDLNADGALNWRDLLRAVSTLYQPVPLLDQQIAKVTQATMRYYGAHGLANAVADGYLPFTQEANGHGIHYYNPVLADQIGNLDYLDIEHLEQPVGLNFDDEGNLLAVFYIHFPERQDPTPENPLAGLLVKAEDDKPPEKSFDTLTADDWHTHQSTWATGLGDLNSEALYFEEGVPFNDIVSRLQEEEFKVFPDSDKSYAPKFWMLHAWVHSRNPAGIFANTFPNLSPYSPEELGAHGHGGHTPFIPGTDAGETLLGSPDSERINGFGGDDLIIGNLGNDHLWGSFGNDLLYGDAASAVQSDLDGLTASSEDGGDDILYGGPGDDLLYGQAGHDKLFGSIGADLLWGGKGDDLLRGGLDDDILTGDDGSKNYHGRDSFVLAPGEGTDTITDFEFEYDWLVLEGGLTLGSLSIEQQDSNVRINFGDETLAILNDVNANNLIAANPFIIA